MVVMWFLRYVVIIICGEAYKCQLCQPLEINLEEDYRINNGGGVGGAGEGAAASITISTLHQGGSITLPITVY